MSWQLISILPASVVVSSTLKSDENVKSSGAHLTTHSMNASSAHPKNCVSSWKKKEENYDEKSG